MVMQSANRGNVSLRNDLTFIFDVLWRRGWLILLCVAVALAFGLAYLQRTPKIYAAKTVIQVEQEERKIVKIEGIQSADLKTLEVLKTYEQSIVNPEVLLRVIHNHDLARDPAFLPEVKEKTSDNS